MNTSNVTNFKQWLSAFRFRTLFLSFSCIGAGLTSTYFFVELNKAIAAFTLLTALFLQILSNLANDYGDSIHGADNEHRKGPKRAVQAGIISSKQMKMAVIVFSILSLISGILLLVFAFPIIELSGIISLFILGLFAIAAAILYTNGKRPYGYLGLGDISVFIFFGLVAVMGTSYLQIGEFKSEILYPSITFGLLSVGVLNVNNMRDIDSDKIAGKYSIPVRLGIERAKIYHYVLIVGSVIFISNYFINNELSFVFLALPLTAFVLHILKISKAKTVEEFDPQLKVLSLSSFLLCLSLIASIVFKA
jgi:1,4-dihydroxy-2-naphthoate octaprenyltransferase